MSLSLLSALSDDVDGTAQKRQRKRWFQCGPRYKTINKKKNFFETARHNKSSCLFTIYFIFVDANRTH